MPSSVADARNGASSARTSSSRSARGRRSPGRRTAPACPFRPGRRPPRRPRTQPNRVGPTWCPGSLHVPRPGRGRPRRIPAGMSRGGGRVTSGLRRAGHAGATVWADGAGLGGGPGPARGGHGRKGSGAAVDILGRRDGARYCSGAEDQAGEVGSTTRSARGRGSKPSRSCSGARGRYLLRSWLAWATASSTASSREPPDPHI